VERAIDRTIAELLRTWRRTGKIGNSSPQSYEEAVKQATAIAYGTARRKVHGAD